MARAGAGLKLLPGAEVDAFMAQLEHPHKPAIEAIRQVVPEALMEMLSKADTAASRRAIAVMLHMKKLDIAALQRAYDNA